MDGDFVAGESWFTKNPARLSTASSSISAAPAPIVMVTSTGLLLVYMGLNVALPSMRSERLLIAQLIDLGVTVPMLAWLAWLRRQPPTVRWRRWFSVLYVVMVFGSLTITAWGRVASQLRVTGLAS